MQFRPVVSAIKKIAPKNMWLPIVIISTAGGEAVLFLPACYFVQRAISKTIARSRYWSFILYTK